MAVCWAFAIEIAMFGKIGDEPGFDIPQKPNEGACRTESYITCLFGSLQVNETRL